MHAQHAPWSDERTPQYGAMAPLGLHTRCDVARLGAGEVLYVGQTAFSPGVWVGVRLDAPVGKNDGSVQGKRYFDAPPGYGVFVRPSQVQTVERDEPVGAQGRTSAVAQTRRADAPVAKRHTDVFAPATPQSVTAARPARASEVRPARASDVGAARARTIAAPRTSTVPSAAEAESPSADRAGRMLRRPAEAARGATGAAAMRSEAMRRLQSARGAAARSSAAGAPATPTRPAVTPTASRLAQRPHGARTPAAAATPSPAETPSPEKLATPPAPAPSRDSAAELGRLRERIAVLEAQNSQYTARIQALEQADAEHRERAAREKEERAALERALSTAEQDAERMRTEHEGVQARITELSDGFEMATLDREMAEERAESLAAQLQVAQERAEELSLELQLGREQAPAPAASDAPAPDAAAQENGRLREALVRLRDVTQETDAEQKREIAALRNDLAQFHELQAAHTSACDARAHLEKLVEELKAQLDAAQDTQGLVEHLAEQKATLEDRVEQLLAEMHELEALKTVSDELEETHLETEAQLQRELDAAEQHAAQQQRSTESLQAQLADAEETVVRFRELVATLVQELDALRAEQPAHGRGTLADDAQDAASSRAHAELDAQRDTGARKAHLGAITPALDRLAALQAHKRLQIAHVYLPDAYWDADHDAGESFLAYERISALADLLRNTLEAHAAVPEQLAGEPDEALVATCELRRALAHASALARQVSAVLGSASPGVFLEHARDHKELEHAETLLAAALEALQHDRFDDRAFARECTSALIPQLEATSFALSDLESTADLAAKETGSATLVSHDVDTLLAAFGVARLTLRRLREDPDLEWADGDALEHAFDRLLAHVKHARAPARQLARRLASLYANGETVSLEAVEVLPETGRSSTELVSVATKLAQRFDAYAREVRVAGSPVDTAELVRMVHAVAVEVELDVQGADDPLEVVRTAAQQLAQALEALLVGATDQANVIKVPITEPWRIRARALQAAVQRDPAAERRLAEAHEQAARLRHELKERHDAAQAAGAKIERLARQLERSREAVTEVADLRAGVEQLEEQLEEQRAENAQLRASAEPADPAPAAAPEAEPEEAPDALRELRNLRWALRFVRAENIALKGSGVMRQFARLPPLHPPPVQTPPPSPPAAAGVPEKARAVRATPQALQTAAQRALQLATAPKVVDLSLGGERRTHWQPRRNTPAGQLAEQQHARAHLQWQLEQLEQQLA